MENGLYSVSDVKEIIMEYFKKTKQKNKKYSFSDIKRIVTQNAGRNLKVNVIKIKDALKSLENDGLIYFDDKKKTYRLFTPDCNLIFGEIKITKKAEGIVEDNDGVKYLIRTDDLLDSLNGDKVVIKPIGKTQNGLPLATVTKIVKRKDGLVFVEVCSDKKGGYYLKPYNSYISRPIKLPSGLMKPLVDGDILSVSIDKLSSNRCYYADFIKHIGHRDDFDTDLKMIAIKNNISIGFSDEALAEAEKIPTEVREIDRVNRLDLTKELIFTIDGEKAKDRDDAVSIRLDQDGNYLVMVPISDVTYYIKPGSKLWEEAEQKSFSRYLGNSCDPMFPHKISNGICSLNPNVDRLALTCMMKISKTGQIIDYDFVDTVINSKKAMTYEKVNEIFETGNIPKDYEPFYDSLVLLRELSEKLEKIKEKRGYVNLCSNEPEFENNAEQVTSVSKRKQGISQKIIENLALLAGECYANYIIIPAPFRVHDKPDEEKMEETFDLLAKSGIKVKSCHDIVNGKVIQQILKQIKDADEREIASNIILRSMKRARYDVEPNEHFGLALPKYGQITSPMRRAGDLNGHYSIKMQRDGKFNVKDENKLYNHMDRLCRHITTMEEKIDQAERDADKLFMARYMADHLGEKFTARVTYITSKSIFVKTENGIDGRIDPRDIEGEKFIYNEKSNAFIGKKSKSRIRIGTQLLVTSLDVSFDNIRFGLEVDDFPTLVKRITA